MSIKPLVARRLEIRCDAVGLLVLGVATLVGSLVFLPRPGALLLETALVGLLFGAPLYLFHARRVARKVVEAPTAPAAAPREAPKRTILHSLVVTLFLVPVFGLGVSVDLGHLCSGISMASVTLLMLEARSLRRWEAGNGMTVLRDRSMARNAPIFYVDGERVAVPIPFSGAPERVDASRD